MTTLHHDRYTPKNRDMWQGLKAIESTPCNFIAENSTVVALLLTNMNSVFRFRIQQKQRESHEMLISRGELFFACDEQMISYAAMRTSPEHQSSPCHSHTNSKKRKRQKNYHSPDSSHSGATVVNGLSDSSTMSSTQLVVSASESDDSDFEDALGITKSGTVRKAVCNTYDASGDSGALATNIGDGTEGDRKYDLLHLMFAQSKVLQQQKVPLSQSIVVLRMSCIQRMQVLLHHSKMGADDMSFSDNIVQESSVIQAILLLDWIIANDLKYFISMKPDVLSAICIILSSAHLQTELLEQLYRIAAFAIYHSEKSSFRQHLAAHVQQIEQSVLRRYNKIVFTDFIGQYYSHDDRAMQRIVHFFYVYMATNSATWLLNTYDTFVEIALQESSDIQIHMDLLDDYLQICV